MAWFIILSFVSDDVFEDFRGWIVTNGRERFEAFLDHPESICGSLDTSQVDAIICCSAEPNASMLEPVPKSLDQRRTFWFE